jgi:hypothetical protein
MKTFNFLEALEANKNAKIRRVDSDLWLNVGFFKDHNVFNVIDVNAQWIIEEPPKDERLYEWRWNEDGEWFVSGDLLTKEQAKKRFSEQEAYEIHSGPHDVGSGKK